MQLALSRIMKGTSWFLRPAATAKPEGPAPTMTGPLTQMQRLLRKSSLVMKLCAMFDKLKQLSLLLYIKKRLKGIGFRRILEGR